MNHLLRYCAIIFNTTLVLAMLSFSQEKIGNKFIKQGVWKNKNVQYVETQINIKIKDKVATSDVNNLIKKLNLDVIEDIDVIRWMLVETKNGVDIFNVMKELQKSPIIENVELNSVGKALTDPNDEFYTDGHQWYLKNLGQTPPAGTVDADIDAPEAWDITQGNSSIKIAILDSGIPKINGNLSHPDLNDYNKYVLLVDYVNEGGEGVAGKCKDYYGHGTHVTGIVGAQSNNSTGIAGIASGCTFYIYKVFDLNGNVVESNFKNAVIHAVNSGVNVINYSGRIPSPTDLTYDAISYANGYNQYGFHVTIVAAAGNSGTNILEAPASLCNSDLTPIKYTVS